MKKGFKYRLGFLIKTYRNKSNLRFILIFALYLISSISNAQQNVIFKYITVSDGLSQSNINCIIQDSKGFMWFGTQDGLNRYNGYDIEIFGLENSGVGNLKGKHISDIIEDKDGIIWIGTWTAGLNSYNHKTGKFSSFQFNKSNPKSISNNHVKCIVEYNDSIFWIGTQDGGLNKFNKKTNEFISYKNSEKDSLSISSNIINCIEKDHQGNLWVGTDIGLDKFNIQTQKFSKIKIKSTLRDGVNDLLCDPKGFVWIATNNGLIKYNCLSQTYNTFIHKQNNNKSISSNKVTYLYIDTSNKLWIGTENGLNLFNKQTNTFTAYKNNNKVLNCLNDNLVLSIYEDKSGIIWVGTKTGGINYFESKPKGFKSYSTIPNNSNSLSKNDVRSFFEENPTKIWIGTLGGGLNLFDRKNKTFTVFKNNPNDKKTISENQINTIFKDSEGILWIGSRDGLNIYNYKTNSFRVIKHNPNNPNSISNNWINIIFEDRNKNIWIGTEGGGLNKYDKTTKSFKKYVHDENSSNSITDNRVRAILEDHKGILWIGTMNGLSKLNTKNDEQVQFYHNPDKSNSLNSNIILTIYEDNLNQIWIGTANGISKLDPKTNNFKNYTTKDGLPNNVVYGILNDKNGNFWISTNHGISKFNRETEVFKNHDSYDGLPSNEFNSGAYLKLTTGEMLFGGTNGFSIFNPDSIKYNDYKPPLLITDFKLFNKSIKAGEKFNNRLILENTIYESDEIELTYKENIFTFEFNAFNYVSPENNRYAYMLEGLEEEWNYVKNRRFATYSTLPTGNYVFKVKASNNDGVWNDTPVSIKITITPPYWATWQFRVLLAIFVILLTYLFYRIRIRNIKLQNKILELKVKTRTKNLYEVNTQLEENQVELEVKQEEIKSQRDAIELQNIELKKLTIVARETDNAIAITDSNGFIEWINEGFTRLYGYTKSELELAGIKNLMDFSINKDINKIVDYCNQTQKSKIYENLTKIKNGNQTWTQTTITPIIGENGDTIKLIVIDSDISKLKKAEEEIKQKNEEILSQRDELEDHRKNLEKLVDERTYELKISKEKAEESDRLKTSFLTNMSHEIRTPMNAIIGFSTLLEENYLDSNERRTLISEITTHTYSLLYLIDNILEIARLDTNQFRIKKERFNLNELLKNTYDSFLDLINLKKIQFELKIPDKNIGIFSDKFRISQIFKNLLDNAIKFTEKGNIQIGYTLERNKIEFFVIDSGIGLFEDQQHHIFERFTKIEDNKKKLYRGAGLGLAICKNIINLLNGDIWVESTPKKGAAFYFTIPHHIETDMVSSNTQSAISNNFDYDWSKKTILIAEDEESNVNYYKMILRKTQINILRAENGKQAIELNKKNKIDLILMDIKMPIMDGLEATKIIKLSYPHIPIISASAFSSKQDIELSKNAGCDFHISKPIQKTEMLNTIKKYIGDN